MNASQTDTKTSAKDPDLPSVAEVLDRRERLLEEQNDLWRQYNQVRQDRKKMMRDAKSQYSIDDLLQYSKTYCQDLTTRVVTLLPRELRDMIYEQLLRLVSWPKDYHTGKDIPEEDKNLSPRHANVFLEYHNCLARVSPPNRGRSSSDSAQDRFRTGEFPAQYRNLQVLCPQFHVELAETYHFRMKFELNRIRDWRDLLHFDTTGAGIEPWRSIRYIRLRSSFGHVERNGAKVRNFLRGLLATGNIPGRTLFLDFYPAAQYQVRKYEERRKEFNKMWSGVQKEYKLLFQRLKAKGFRIELSRCRRFKGD